MDKKTYGEIISKSQELLNEQGINLKCGLFIKVIAGSAVNVLLRHDPRMEKDQIFLFKTMKGEEGGIDYGFDYVFDFGSDL